MMTIGMLLITAANLLVLRFGYAQLRGVWVLTARRDRALRGYVARVNC